MQELLACSAENLQASASAMGDSLFTGTLSPNVIWTPPGFITLGRSLSSTVYGIKKTIFFEDTELVAKCHGGAPT
eukprot:3860893-Prorocentrum_lima.AAC.1